VATVGLQYAVDRQTETAEENTTLTEDETALMRLVEKGAAGSLRRVLRKREFERAAGPASIRADAPVVAATKHLAGMAGAGAFARIPTAALAFSRCGFRLCEAAGRHPGLGPRVSEEAGPRLGRTRTGITTRAVGRLQDHDWPANSHVPQNGIEGTALSAGRRTRSRVPSRTCDPQAAVPNQKATFLPRNSS
jgi:DNA-binding NtrC family response regulator